jgi:hypothetical protein
MLGWRPGEDHGGHSGLLPGEPIQLHHRVGDVLQRYPHLLAVFLTAGFKPLASAWLRQRLAHRVTIAQACRLIGVEPEPLLVELNGKRLDQAAITISLPIPV